MQFCVFMVFEATRPLCCVSDSGASPAQVVNQVSRLVSDQHDGGFHSLLGDTDVDRFSATETVVYCLKVKRFCS